MPRKRVSSTTLVAPRSLVIRPEQVNLLHRVGQGPHYPDNHLVKLAERFPSPQKLKTLEADGFVPMPLPPVSLPLSRLMAMEDSLLEEDEWSVGKAERCLTTDMTGTAGWFALYNGPVPRSLNQSWLEQIEWVQPEYECVPNVAQTVWAARLLSEVCGVRPFEGIDVRTSSVTSLGWHVCVRVLDKYRFRITACPDDERRKRLGLALIRF